MINSTTKEKGFVGEKEKKSFVIVYASTQLNIKSDK